MEHEHARMHTHAEVYGIIIVIVDHVKNDYSVLIICGDCIDLSVAIWA